jgi:hypothetical protein
MLTKTSTVMTQQPDNLFKGKLEHYSRPAPAMAWDKIEARLDKSSSRMVWMKVAASVTAAVVATYLLWPTSTETVAPLANQANKHQEQTVPAKEESLPPTQQTSTAVYHAKAKQPTVSTHTVDQHTITPTQEVPAPVVTHDNATVAMTESLPVTENTEVNTTQVVMEPVSVRETVTITYSADEVNNRFLIKNIEEEATSDEKKPSGIQKLLTLAADIKNNDGGLGELREKKNEILALNFRDEKRGQNK